MDAMAFVLALVPIMWLVVVLLVFKWPAWKAAIGSFVLSCVLALGVWKLPADQVATASLEGFLMALWPIVLVIIAAVFTYNLCVKTGAMDVIGGMITSISSDRRLLALLIAWCFGGFMEGMAGFGTAVAIPASMLAGLGFAPIPAVLLCLLANGVPTPYGSIGIPTVSLAGLVGLDSAHLAFVQMVQLAPFYIVAPFLIVLVAGKVEGASVADRLRGVVVPTLAAGLAFTLPTMAVAAFVGPELSVVVGSICALAVTALLAMRAEHSGKLDKRFHVAVEPHEALTLGGALRAWSCFILIFILLMGTSKLVPFVNSALAPLSSSVQVFSGKNPGTLSFMWVNTPGIWIFLAAIVGGFIQGAAYPLIAPWIGAVGTFVTGSGTSSAMLFGPVQKQAADALGTDPYWMVALNMLGVSAGKMLSPQSLAIGLASVRVVGKDAELMRAIIPYGIAFLVLMSILALAGAGLVL